MRTDQLQDSVHRNNKQELPIIAPIADPDPPDTSTPTAAPRAAAARYPDIPRILDDTSVALNSFANVKRGNSSLHDIKQNIQTYRFDL
ncbi:hypothetical protein, partial [Alicyclobacillus suci]|uniref:hypothetical protein n=1 Tax=Alicyclobacillus suci TaxID=2816080 RepID=UPI001A8F6EB6